MTYPITWLVCRCAPKGPRAAVFSYICTQFRARTPPATTTVGYKGCSKILIRNFAYFYFFENLQAFPAEFQNRQRANFTILPIASFRGMRNIGNFSDFKLFFAKCAVGRKFVIFRHAKFREIFSISNVFCVTPHTNQHHAFINSIKRLFPAT